ncbi:MAG: MFS transporter, partial [Gammaproteobacteria bacterium]|nr:MFS transporter [Gammaproteobacteria bacterium]
MAYGVALKMIKTFIFCIIGSTLEWYDFSVFGVLAPILSRIFFPHHDKTVALLMTFAIFATGFIMRPLGGIFFGHIGDRFGRKKAIVSSVFLMTIATVCIGLLPVKHFSAHVLLISLFALRLLQGFAVSGEYSGMFTFISEIVPRKNFFFYQSFVCFGAVGGLLLGTIVGSVALSFYHGDFTSNAWRIPFLLSIFLGVLGLYLRLKIEESPIFSKLKQSDKQIKLPIKHVVVNYYRVIIFLLFMTMVEAIGFYFVVVFYPSFINKLGISAHHYLHIVTIGLVLLFIMTPIVGVLAD